MSGLRRAASEKELSTTMFFDQLFANDDNDAADGLETDLREEEEFETG
jgi:hypothetical protein